jgi:ParB family chromosome partitioning protein
MARKVLGKGLGALIPEMSEEAASAEGQRIVDLNVSDISPNPHQPRLDFNPQSIDELKRSILEKGVIQPILVRRFGNGYQVIAGERRLRAARLAGLETIPSTIADVSSSEEMMELSLIENIQREDLNPIDEAKAYRALIDQCYLTQEEVSKKVGKDRSTVANLLRLLRLPSEVQERLYDGTLTMGHARALLGIDDEEFQVDLCRKIAKEAISVRKVEQLIRTRAISGGKPKVGRSIRRKDPILISMEEEMQRRLGTAVHITKSGKKGKVEIEFYNDHDLERIIEILRGNE